LNVLQSNGRDQSKVVEVIEKTLWVCHGIPGITSPSGDKLIAGIAGIYYWFSVQQRYRYEPILTGMEKGGHAANFISNGRGI